MFKELWQGPSLPKYSKPLQKIIIFQSVFLNEIFTNQLVYSSKGFFLHLQVITCYKSILFWGNPEKQSKPSTYSGKISEIVGALSNFSERPPLSGMDRMSSSPWKNTNYSTYCIFCFGVFFLIFTLASLEDYLYVNTL